MYVLPQYEILDARLTMKTERKKKESKEQEAEK